ncbi:hypothetical protein [Deferribacter abyssi]
MYSRLRFNKYDKRLFFLPLARYKRELKKANAKIIIEIKNSFIID